MIPEVPVFAQVVGISIVLIAEAQRYMAPLERDARQALPRQS